MKQPKLSEHVVVDHPDRVLWIATEIGFGQLIDTIQIYDVDRGYRRVELYETGVAVIKAVDEEFVITMYLPTQRQLIKWYGSKNSVPIRLLNISKKMKRKAGLANEQLLI